MTQWYDADGKPLVPNCYTCPRCGYRYKTLDKMSMRIMSKYKSLPVHFFCVCGKDLGKFE